MSDSAGLRKPLHPFVKFVAIVTVIMVALDVTIAILTNDKTVGLPLDAQVRIGVWISDAGQIILQVAYLTGLAVVVELIDRILWRLTPEAERRVGRSRRSA